MKNTVKTVVVEAVQLVNTTNPHNVPREYSDGSKPRALSYARQHTLHRATAHEYPRGSILALTCSCGAPSRTFLLLLWSGTERQSHRRMIVRKVGWTAGILTILTIFEINLGSCAVGRAGTREVDVVVSTTRRRQGDRELDEALHLTEPEEWRAFHL